VGGAAYMMIECLVYIGVLFALLGVGYAAMYRCITNSVALRRNADDISSALHAGERWRADLRSAAGPIRVQTSASEQVILFSAAQGELAYRFATNAVFRRVGQHPWVRQLERVKASDMQADPRQSVTPWRWELELQPRSKSARIRPLF